MPKARLHVVLNKDLGPVHSGTPDEVVTWLRANYGAIADGQARWVRTGNIKSVTDVSDYLYNAERHEQGRKAAHNKKFNAILELVREAIDVGDPNAHACDITARIMEIK